VCVCVYESTCMCLWYFPVVCISLYVGIVCGSRTCCFAHFLKCVLAHSFFFSVVHILLKFYCQIDCSADVIYVSGSCGATFYVPDSFLRHLEKEHSQLAIYSCHLCPSKSLKPDRLLAVSVLWTYYCCNVI